MDMVERVGNAVLDELSDRKGFRHLIDDIDDEVLTEIRQCVARAAIAAMREPTRAMQNAGWREIDAQGFATEDTEVAPIYRAMIDAALTSSEPQAPASE